MRLRNASLLVALVALSVLVCPYMASGQVNDLHIVSRPAPADVLPGYVANDLFIDFTGLYTGSQVTVELMSGAIYQNEFGGNTPPLEALIGADPTVEWDTFVTQGGPTDADTIGNFGFGGAAIHIWPNPGRDAKFDSEGIDQTWNPAGGTEILDQTGFMVARITLSDDANGLLQYYAAANEVAGVGQPGRIVMLPIRNGVVIPEPATWGLLAVGLAVAMATRRYARRRLCARQTRPPWRH